jgi:hypothetical protein
METESGMPGSESRQGDEIFLERWSIRETDQHARHFVGFNMLRGNGRVSTPIAEFDPVTRTGKTRSGRRYRLVGRAGHDADGNTCGVSQSKHGESSHGPT